MDWTCADPVLVKSTVRLLIVSDELACHFVLLLPSMAPSVNWPGIIVLFDPVIGRHWRMLLSIVEFALELLFLRTKVPRGESWNVLSLDGRWLTRTVISVSLNVMFAVDNGASRRASVV